MTILATLFVIGWVAAAALGTLAYFLGEQTKPIHERNWRSQSFEALAEAITGKAMEGDRVPAFVVTDAYSSRVLPNA